MAGPVFFDSTNRMSLPDASGTSPEVSSAGSPDANGIWRWVPPLPLLSALVALLRVVSQPLSLLNDPDTYLHIAAGRWIIEHVALPTADPFSHTMAGAQWVPHEWLAEIVLAVAYRLGGWNGVILLTGGSFAIAMAILSRRLLRHVEPLAASVVLVATIGLLLPHLLARPHILVLPLVVAWCGALFDARDAGRLPPLALLPVMTLWANFHGSFMFGLALAAFLAFEAVVQADTIRMQWREASRWAAYLLAAILASLLTPNGIAGFLLPFHLLAMPTLQSSFGEWASPSIAQVPALELWVLGAIGLAFLTGAKLPVTRLILLLGLFHLAFQHVRHVDLLGVVAPVALAAPLGAALAATPRAGNSRLTNLLRHLTMPARPLQGAVAAMIAAIIMLPAIAHPLARTDDAVTPAAALAAAERMGLSGPVLNEEGFGGYLTFHGTPTFVDGRIEMYGDAFLATYLKAERGDEAALTQALDHYGIEWTLFSPEAGATAVLGRLPGWRRAYADTRAIIHVRTTDPARLDTRRAPL